MRPAARISAAIDILAQFETNPRPIGKILAAFARTNRYAGSKDRRAINDLVYDALRRRASYAAVMSDTSPRALLLAALVDARKLAADEIKALFDGSRHAPAPLNDDELAALSGMQVEKKLVADPAASADFPDWLYPSIERVYGADALPLGRALAVRAPVDLRVNRLKAAPDRALAILDEWDPLSITGLQDGIRLHQDGTDYRNIAVKTLPQFEAGWFEVQDAGSQIATLLSAAAPGQTLLDLCAGGGGKTLGMAAMMANEGRILAYDLDAERLAALTERIERAGIQNVELLPAGDEAALAALEDRMDVVLVDAPCSGSGTWRRKPDAKWLLTPAQLEQRLADQRQVLASGAKAVRSGGRLVYVTCSILAEENSEQIEAFLAAHPDFHLVPFETVWRETQSAPPPVSALALNGMLQLTPAHNDTDGFFVAILQRA